MKKELEIFFTALMFYTRIPAPKGLVYSKEQHQKSIKYLPLIGMLVGGLSAATLVVSNYIFPVSISVIFSMLCSVLITGAFHEDGLADTVDGFGGGWNKEKILQIMKDSSIGAYGAIALVVTLLLKYQLLVELFQSPVKSAISNQSLIIFVLIAGHSLSRVMAVTTMVTHNYVRLSDTSSKTKSITAQNLKWTNPTILMAIIISIIPLFLFKNFLFFSVLIPMYLTKIFLSNFFNKWIDGYTGDCLGAIQQVTEIVFYLGILVLWKFI